MVYYKTSVKMIKMIRVPIASLTKKLDVLDEMVFIRASQNFRGYLPHSGLSSEWAGATLVGVSEG